MTRRIGVVGSGVAGLLAAHVLTRSGHDVVLFEADERPGGHAHTHDVDLGDGTPIAIDSGFLVHNDRTYPTLTRLFRDLGIERHRTIMSMSVRDDAVGAFGLEYAGAKKLPGLFADPRNLLRPRYLQMLREILRFHREARALLGDSTAAVSPGAVADADDEPLGAWLARHGFGGWFEAHFVRPLIAAVWSCDESRSLEYPARYLFAFLEHHGMLSVAGSPPWYTIVGGSREYVSRVVDGLADVRLSTPVQEVRDLGEGRGVRITDAGGGTTEVDGVVVATHPHQALRMLAEPTQAQREVLGAITYSVNAAQVHTDDSLLPRRRAARAAWNYLAEPATDDDDGGVLVTYDITRLMGLPVVAGRRVLVTLNGEHRVRPESVLATTTYEHPIYTPDAVAAQRRLLDIETSRLAFAGAYHGWGFHEDGALSGLRAAERLGGSWPDAAASPTDRQPTGADQPARRGRRTHDLAAGGGG